MEKLKVEKSEHDEFVFHYISVNGRCIGYIAITNRGAIYGCLFDVTGRYDDETQNYSWDAIKEGDVDDR